MATTRDLMRQLEDGELTIDDVAAALSEKQVPRAQKSGSPDDIDVTADPDHPGEDSLFWVGQANFKGAITDEEYDILVRAAG